MERKNAILTLAIITIALFGITVRCLYLYYDEPCNSCMSAVVFNGVLTFLYYIILCLKISEEDKEWYI